MNQAGEIEGCPSDIDKNLADVLGVIEFLGREQRHAQPKAKEKMQQESAA